MITTESTSITPPKVTNSVEERQLNLSARGGSGRGKREEGERECRSLIPLVPPSISSASRGHLFPFSSKAAEQDVLVVGAAVFCSKKHVSGRSGSMEREL